MREMLAQIPVPVLLPLSTRTVFSSKYAYRYVIAPSAFFKLVKQKKHNSQENFSFRLICRADLTELAGFPASEIGKQSGFCMLAGVSYFHRGQVKSETVVQLAENVALALNSSCKTAKKGKVGCLTTSLH